MFWVLPVVGITVRVPLASVCTTIGLAPSFVSCMYAMRLPSGDHAGDMTAMPAGVTATASAPSLSSRQIRLSWSLRKRMRVAATPGCPVASRTISSESRWMPSRASPIPLSSMGSVSSPRTRSAARSCSRAVTPPPGAATSSRASDPPRVR